ncbi:uncharacterized protein LOC135817747 isoform X2 [Sycon ciliatum]
MTEDRKDVIRLGKNGETPPGDVDPLFVYQSAMFNRLQDLRSYTLGPKPLPPPVPSPPKPQSKFVTSPRNPHVSHSPATAVTGRTPFSAVEDALILKYFHEHRHKYAGSYSKKLWLRVCEEEPLKHRTFEALRTRFQKFLSSKLEKSPTERMTSTKLASLATKSASTSSASPAVRGAPAGRPTAAAAAASQPMTSPRSDRSAHKVHTPAKRKRSPSPAGRDSAAKRPTAASTAKSKKASRGDAAIGDSPLSEGVTQQQGIAAMQHSPESSPASPVLAKKTYVAKAAASRLSPGADKKNSLKSPVVAAESSTASSVLAKKTYVTKAAASRLSPGADKNKSLKSQAVAAESGTAEQSNVGCGAKRGIVHTAAASNAAAKVPTTGNTTAKLSARPGLHQRKSPRKDQVRIEELSAPSTHGEDSDLSDSQNEPEPAAGSGSGSGSAQKKKIVRAKKQKVKFTVDAVRRKKARMKKALLEATVSEDCDDDNDDDAMVDIGPRTEARRKLHFAVGKLDGAGDITQSQTAAIGTGSPAQSAKTSSGINSRQFGGMVSVDSVDKKLYSAAQRQSKRSSSASHDGSSSDDEDQAVSATKPAMFPGKRVSRSKQSTPVAPAAAVAACQKSTPDLSAMLSDCSRSDIPTLGGALRDVFGLHLQVLRVAVDGGHSYVDALKLMHSCSCNYSDALTVARGEDPSEGLHVWTPEEDTVLLGRRCRFRTQLIDLLGQEACDSRIRYLKS